MNKEQMHKACDLLKEAGFHNTEVFAVPNSGHHMYLEGPSFTNEVLVRELAKIPAE